MALTIHTNYSSLVTQTNLNKTNNALATNQIGRASCRERV